MWYTNYITTQGQRRRDEIMVKVKVRHSPGDMCTADHKRSDGIRSFYAALRVAEGDETRVVPCMPCEVYFIGEPGDYPNPFAGVLPQPEIDKIKAEFAKEA